MSSSSHPVCYLSHSYNQHNQSSQRREKVPIGQGITDLSVLGAVLRGLLVIAIVCGVAAHATQCPDWSSSVAGEFKNIPENMVCSGRRFEVRPKMLQRNTLNSRYEAEGVEIYPAFCFSVSQLHSCHFNLAQGTMIGSEVNDNCPCR